MMFREWLESRNACGEALRWVGDRTLEQAWSDCENGEWMWWLMWVLFVYGPLEQWNRIVASLRPLKNDRDLRYDREEDTTMVRRIYADGIRKLYPTIGDLTRPLYTIEHTS